MINIENMRKPAKTPRADMPCQPTAVRAHNFKEVTLGYLLEQVQLKASCCLRCKNPCRRQGYPVEVRILEFVAQVVEGDVAETYRILKNTNSFSAACGCVYLQENQCEGKRILSVKGKPVAIDHLERSVTDNAMYDPCVGVSDNDACAVINPDLKAVCIGSDPSFIIVVGHLAVRGVKVTVFEASHEAGGVLIYGIPAPRLPEGVVTAGSDGLRQSNVEFHINWVGGRMASIWQLFDKDYKTVFVGVGADLLQFLDTPGESLTGVPFANGYLTRMNLEYVYNFSNLDMPTYPGRHVMVLGAGNVAMDVTRTALRLGVESPIIIYRHSCAGMSARHEKIERMEEEGVRLFELVRPLYFSASESGIPKSVTLQRMALGEPDASERRRPIPIEGEVFEHEMNLAAVAAGTRSNPILLETTPGPELNRRGYTVVNEKTGGMSTPSVFAGSGIVTGAATVILAMGTGRKATQEIAKRLLG